MRHNKHRHQLGVKKEHREAIMASLSAALFRHDRIQTTLGYAKALRPFAEKIITLAKKAAMTDDVAVKLHYRRMALSQVRDETAVKMLFNEKAEKFIERKGGYTRIYKLLERVGDAAPMALIELIEADDKGYKKGSKKKAAKKAVKAEAPVVEETPAVEEVATEEAPAAEAVEATEEAKA